MKKIKNFKESMGSITLLLLMLLIVTFTNAQVKYSSKDDLNLLISGTSTLHDWDMKAEKGECIAVFNFNAAGDINALSSLSVIIPAEGLKSEHSGMDKNAYKALKTDKAPTISYKLTSATILGNNTIKCMGKLNIAGTTKDAELNATYKLNSDKSITVSGKKNISMKDFNMEPPSFMMGTIKTGNDIVLKFDLVLRK